MFLITCQSVSLLLAIITALLPLLTLHHGELSLKGASWRDAGFIVIKSAPWETLLEALVFKLKPLPYTIFKSTYKLHMS